MGRIFKNEDISLELLEDDTWKLLEIRGEAQMPASAEGKPITVIAPLAFEYRSSLKHVIVPEGVREVMPKGFMSRDIVTIQLPSTVETIAPEAFSYDVILESISVSESNPYFRSEDGILYSRDGSTLVRVPSAHSTDDVRFPDSLQVIGESSLAECWRMYEFTVPKNVHTIKTHAFRECEHLQTVRFPDAIRDIEFEAFDGCYKFEKFVLPASVKDLGDRSPFGDPGMIRHFCFPDWMEKAPAWFSVVDPFCLKEFESRTMSVYDVPMKYRDAFIRNVARRYCEGEEFDMYMMEDCLVYAGDRRNVLFPEMLENDLLLRFLLDKKIVSVSEARDLASRASDMGKVEITAQLVRYASEREGKSFGDLESLEL